MLGNKLQRSRWVAAGMSAVLAVAAGSWLISSPANAATPSTATPPPLRHLLVAGFGSGNIGVLGVDRDANLSSVPGSPFKADVGFPLVVSPDGKHAYVASLTGNITGFQIDGDGTLTQLTQVKAPNSAAGLALTPDGKKLFATLGGANTTTSVVSYNVSPDGTLASTGQQPTVIPGSALMALSLPAITPDGKYLFVTGAFTNTLNTFAIGSDASLTPVGPQLTTGDRPVLPGVTPDGRFLYVTMEGGNSIQGWAIGSGGTLTPVPGGPVKLESMPHGVAVTPDSRRLYLPTAGGNTVDGFQIGDDGTLTPLPGSPYPRPGGLPGRTVLSPDAKHLFVIDVAEGLTSSDPALVHTYNVNPDGSITSTGQASTGVNFADGPSSAITPNQGPVAALAVQSAQGRTQTFTAQDSTDSDGSVARYDWDFGDGQTASTTTPQTSHTYGQAGNYTATVTVTDDEGCSTHQVFNGQLVNCNGGPQARKSVPVTVS